MNTSKKKFPKNPKESTDVPFYRDLISECKDSLKLLNTAVVYPVSVNALQGAVRAAELKLLKLALIGPKDLIHQAAEESSLDISNYELVTAKYSHEAARIAADMAREGKVDALMKGHIHTDVLLRSIMEKKRFAYGPAYEPCVCY